MRAVETKKVLSSTDGFTIVETLIVLAVSSILGLSTFLFLIHEVDSNSFSTAATNFSEQLQQVVVDTSSGYYYNHNLSCSANLSSITLSQNDPTDQGTNTGCISVGTAIQFAPSGESGQFLIIPMAGSQYDADGIDTTNLGVNGANIKPIEPSYGSGTTANLTTSQTLSDSLKIVSVKAENADGSSTLNTGAIGLLLGDSSQNVAYTNGDGTLNSNTLPVSLYYFTGANINTAQKATAGKLIATNLVYTKQVDICATDGSQSVDLTLAGSNVSQISSKIYNDTSC